MLVVLLSCEYRSERKIKLASETEAAQSFSQTASRVLQVSPEQQRSIAILHFENESGVASLEWLRRGLADMLVTELSQSPYLNVITMNRLQEIAQQTGNGNANLDKLSLAAIAAGNAQADIVLSGRFFRNGDSLRIDVELQDASTAQLIRKETVQGEGLEQIFAMVAELSDRVRSRLRGDLETIQMNDLDITKLTSSVEAFRWYSQALEHIEKFLKPEAEKCLMDAIKADSTFAAAYLRLAQLKMEMGDVKAAQKYIKQTKRYAHRLSERDQVYLELAEVRLKGNYDKVISILREGLKRLPADVDIRLQLARTYRGFGYLDRALEEFETVLDMDPNRKMVYNDLGYLFAERGDFTSAIKYIDKYQELAPNEPNPFDSKGEILMMAGRLGEAAEQLKMALEKWPTFHYSALRLSEIYTEFGDFDKTIEYLHRADESSSSKKENVFDIRSAMIHWRFGKTEKAMSIIDQLLEESPTNPHLVTVATEMYRTLGDSEKIAKVHRNALDHFKEKANKDTGVDEIVGLFLSSNISPRKAIPLLENLVKQHTQPGLQTYITQLALCLMYYRAGEIPRGENTLQNNSEGLLNLLVLHRSGGWGTMWKYFFESFEWQIKTNPEQAGVPGELLSIAQKLNRKDLEVMARFARARQYDIQNNPEAIAKEYQRLGSPLEHKWQVIGPFSVEDVSPFEHSFPPENNIDMEAVYSNGEDEISWRPGNDGSHDGYVNLKAIFDHSLWSVGYGLLYVYSPEERKVQIRLGTDETCKLWLNDKQIWQHYTKRDALVDRDLVTVVLHPGYNKLLLKVTNVLADWGYFLRVTDEEGNGIPEISFHSAEEVKDGLASR